jgi:hypothetical protein
VRLQAAVVDLEARTRDLATALEHARAGAPRQELRIVLDIVDEREHLLGRAWHEDGSGDGRHECAR